jgi:hypothetical protein
MWTTTETKTGRSIRLVNGERLEEYRPEYPALAEAGAQGWELLAVLAVGAKYRSPEVAKGLTEAVAGGVW